MVESLSATAELFNKISEAKDESSREKLSYRTAGLVLFGIALSMDRIGK
jgi:hypothetical protein